MRGVRATGVALLDEQTALVAAHDEWLWRMERHSSQTEFMYNVMFIIIIILIFVSLFGFVLSIL